MQYIPVSNKKSSSDWFIHHFGLVLDGDHLRAGNQEIFLLETSENQTSNFFTKGWIQGVEFFEMPAICFRASNLAQLYEYTVGQSIRTDGFREEGWFWEFDFYDLDGNKFKAWQPK